MVSRGDTVGNDEDMRSRRWDELSTRAKGLVMLSTSVQISLAVSAWADLTRRPPEAIRGPKRKWAALIAITFVGPIWYFLRGRRPTRDVDVPAPDMAG